MTLHFSVYAGSFGMQVDEIYVQEARITERDGPAHAVKVGERAKGCYQKSSDFFIDDW